MPRMDIDDSQDINEEHWKSILIDLMKTEYPSGHADDRAKLNERTVSHAEWLEDEYGYHINMDYAIRVVECVISFPLELGTLLKNVEL